MIFWILHRYFDWNGLHVARHLQDTPRFHKMTSQRPNGASFHRSDSTLSAEKAHHRVSRHKQILNDASSVPWIDFWELKAVGQSLLTAADLSYGSNIQGYTTEDIMPLGEALARVDRWKNRSSKGLPASVESTAALSFALWRDLGDQHNINQHFRLMPTERQNLYATAIIRAINGIADPFQQNRSFVGSVAHICAQVGVPVWLVDVRHEATHNQMPSLFVLRTGAAALVRYLASVYWEPLFLAWKQDEATILSCLDDHHQALKLYQPDKKLAPNTPQSKDAAKQLRTKPPKGGDDKSDYFDFGDGADKNDDNSVSGEMSIIGPSSLSRLGTITNMFAILEGPKKVKKSKKKLRQEEEARVREIERQREERLVKRQVIRPPEFFLQRLFELKVNADNLWHTLLTFLVLGDTVSGRRGCLLPKVGDEEFECTEEGANRIKGRFQPLLAAIGKRWPGFLVALFNTIVDAILSIRDKDQTERSKVYDGFFLMVWVRFLVSNVFLSSCSIPHAIKGRSTPAPLKVLRSVNYPLNSLCDRIIDCESSSKAQCSTTRELKELLLEILGTERCEIILTQPNILPNDPTNKSSDPVQSKTKTISDSVAIQQESAKSLDGPLSLDEMEALLSSGASPQVAEQKVEECPAEEDIMEDGKSNLQSRPTAWTRCQSWEPCAIGAMPGFPP